MLADISVWAGLEEAEQEIGENGESTTLLLSAALHAMRFCTDEYPVISCIALKRISADPFL